MICIDEVDDDILEEILENSSREEVQEMSAHDALDGYLNYEGVIGYTGKILSAWDNLSVAELLADAEAVVSKADLADLKANIMEKGHRGDDRLIAILEISKVEQLKELI